MIMAKKIKYKPKGFTRHHKAHVLNALKGRTYKPKKLIYEQIYDKLEKIGILKLKPGQYTKLKSRAFMDLAVEHLYRNVFSLTHYYKQGGDLVPDPDMQIRVMPEGKMAEAMSYQDTYGYRQVYSDGKVDLKAKKELNAFLNKWLSNLIRQGFKY